MGSIVVDVVAVDVVVVGGDLVVDDSLAPGDVVVDDVSIEVALDDVEEPAEVPGSVSPHAETTSATRATVMHNRRVMSNPSCSADLVPPSFH